MANPRHTLQYRDPAQLKAYANNSRTHSAQQVAQIRASINEFGFTNPVLLKDDGITIGAGHGRVQAALLGPALKEVPTIVLRGLSEDQWRAYVIADNKLALNAGWDNAMLAAEIEALMANDYDVTLLGFDEGELDTLLQGDPLPIHDGGSDESTSSSSQVFLRVDETKIPMSEGEHEGMEELLKEYGDEHGSYYGFAAWLVARVHASRS